MGPSISLVTRWGRPAPARQGIDTSQLALPKPVKRKSEKRRRQADHRAETAAIRAAVFARNRGRCEAGCSQLATVLDHWLGGAGRRRQKQSVETCWALCADCDRERTFNIPDARSWNLRREFFCSLHRYPFVPHLEKQSLPTRKRG